MPVGRLPALTLVPVAAKDRLGALLCGSVGPGDEERLLAWRMYALCGDVGERGKLIVVRQAEAQAWGANAYRVGRPVVGDHAGSLAEGRSAVHVDSPGPGCDGELSEVLAEMDIGLTVDGYAVPAEDLAVAALLVEAGSLEGEGRDEDASCASLGGDLLEAVDEVGADACAALVCANPGHADAGGLLPGPAADAAEQFTVLVEVLHGELGCCGAGDGCCVDDVEFVGEALVERGVGFADEDPRGHGQDRRTRRWLGSRR